MRCVASRTLSQGQPRPSGTSHHRNTTIAWVRVSLAVATVRSRFLNHSVFHRSGVTGRRSHFNYLSLATSDQCSGPCDYTERQNRDCYLLCRPPFRESGLLVVYETSMLLANLFTPKAVEFHIRYSVPADLITAEKGTRAQAKIVPHVGRRHSPSSIAASADVLLGWMEQADSLPRSLTSVPKPFLQRVC